jgi:WD40 repeat protein
MVLIKINFKNEEICSSSLSNKGKILTVGSSSGNIRILNYKERFNPVKIFKSHDLEITKIVTKNSKIFSCSLDSKLKIWDIQEQKLITTFIDHYGSINDLDVMEKYICTASEDGDVRIWDHRIRNSIGKLKHGFNLQGSRFLKNQNLIVSYGLADSLYIWDLRMNNVFLNKSRVLKNSRSALMSVGISNLSNFLFILDSGYKLHRVHTHFRQRSKRCALLIEKKNLIFQSRKNLLKLNLDDQGKFVLNGDLKGNSYVRSQKNGKVVTRFNDHLESVKEVIFSSKNKVFVSCSTDGSIVVRTQ